MTGLLLVALAGLGASFVDGALGMGFGITSTTLLLAFGLSPALASASVHLAKIGTALASGIAHHRFGNVDWPAVRRLGLPGAIGAFAGATVLSAVSTRLALPFVGGLLFLLGVYILIRFLVGHALGRRHGTPGWRMLIPLGLVGGFVDATGGGGWGPVTTPTLLADGRLSPRRVVGTVNTAEFLVAVAATLGFLLGLGLSGIDLGVVVALLIGGVIAAPLAAGLVRYLNPRLLGVVIGGVICLVNARLVLGALDADAGVWIACYAILLTAAVGALSYVIRIVRTPTPGRSSGGTVQKTAR